MKKLLLNSFVTVIFCSLIAEGKGQTANKFGNYRINQDAVYKSMPATVSSSSLNVSIAVPVPGKEDSTFFGYFKHNARISNISYTGANGAFAVFADSTNAYGIAKGFAISSTCVSGLARNCYDPAVPCSIWGASAVQDSDLVKIMVDESSPSNANATSAVGLAKIEFDYKPEVDTFVICKFVVGSPDFMPDAFGIFVSGLGFSGNENIALLPDTALPINAVTLGRGSIKSQYQPALALPCNQLVSSSFWTKPFYAKADLKAGNLYHFKIAVADAMDNFASMAIFMDLDIPEDVKYTTEMNKLEMDNVELSIYPNPNNGVFSVHLYKADARFNSEPSQLEIYNVMGDQVYKSSLEYGVSSSIDLSSQPSGIYFLYTQCNGQKVVRKLIRE